MLIMANLVQIKQIIYKRKEILLNFKQDLVTKSTYLICKNSTYAINVLHNLQLQILPFHDFMCSLNSDRMLELFSSSASEDHKR